MESRFSISTFLNSLYRFVYDPYTFRICRGSMASIYKLEWLSIKFSCLTWDRLKFFSQKSWTWWILRIWRYFIAYLHIWIFSYLIVTIWALVTETFLPFNVWIFYIYIQIKFFSFINFYLSMPLKILSVFWTIWF